MKQSNIDFLEANYGYWITLRDAGFMRNLDGSIREGMQRVMAEEFSPGYRADLWCPTCVSDMVKALYTRYDQFKAMNKSEEPKPDPIPMQEPATAEVIQTNEDGSVKVKASFPEQTKPNKKQRRHGK